MDAPCYNVAFETPDGRMKHTFLEKDASLTVVRMLKMAAFDLCLGDNIPQSCLSFFRVPSVAGDRPTTAEVARVVDSDLVDPRTALPNDEQVPNDPKAWLLLRYTTPSGTYRTFGFTRAPAASELRRARLVHSS
jgi:hypothetical protein